MRGGCLCAGDEAEHSGSADVAVTGPLGQCRPRPHTRTSWPALSPAMLSRPGPAPAARATYLRSLRCMLRPRCSRSYWRRRRPLPHSECRVCSEGRGQVRTRPAARVPREGPRAWRRRCVPTPPHPPNLSPAVPGRGAVRPRDAWKATRPSGHPDGGARGAPVPGPGPAPPALTLTEDALRGTHRCNVPTCLADRTEGTRALRPAPGGPPPHATPTAPHAHAA